jgi:DNA modification methylase
MNTWRIIEGDCLEVMAGMEAGSVDHIVTDPPYDEKTHKGHNTEVRPGMNQIEFKPLLDIEKTVSEMLRLSHRWTVAFCSMEMLGDYARASGDQWVRSGFWRKTNGAPQFTGDRPGQGGEGIAIMHSKVKKEWNGGGKHGFWEFPIGQEKKLHQTQKPVALMKRLIVDFTNPGDLVLDPFCGSGTTGVACIETGRNFIGIELNPDYCEIARRRIDEASK